MTCGQTWKFLTGARSKYSSLSIFVIPTLQYNSIAVRLLRNHICKKQKTLHWRESNIASSFALLISSRFVRQVWDIWEIRIDNPMFVKRAFAESYFDWCLNHWTPRLNTWCRRPSWRVMQGIARRVQLAKWRSSPDAVMSCWWSCPLHSTLVEAATLCVTITTWHFNLHLLRLRGETRAENLRFGFMFLRNKTEVCLMPKMLKTTTDR